MKKINVLEVNDEDIIGRRFNGYEICDYFKSSKRFKINQLVLFKKSNNNNVSTFTDEIKTSYIIKLSILEEVFLSTHNQLSLSSIFLHNNKLYKQCDIVHFHMYHNTKLSIYDLINISKEKKIIISLHDPWWMSGRCVHAYKCNKWIDGCHKCEYLDTLFPMNFDNTRSMWNLKRNVLSSIDATFLYPSKYVGELVYKSNILKNEKLHFVPFGIDSNLFCPRDKKKLRRKYQIGDDEIVISFRAQNEFKGTKYIIEALNELNSDKKIKIFTIDQKNTLNSLKNKYEILDLGIINSEKLIEIYNISDMFLSPSISETFGFMAIESLSCETPVIVFNNTSLPSVTFAPECGLVANDLDSHDLMNKIELLINDREERIKRGKLGRKLVIENYSLDVYYKKLENLYLNKYKENKKTLPYPNKNCDKKDVKFLKRKLKIIYYNLFYEKINNKLFKTCSHTLFLKNYSIDYSKKEIQDLICKFNNIIFERIQTVNKIKRNYFVTFIYLLIYDKKRIIKIIKKRLRR